MNTIAKKIAEQRKKMGLSQEELADKSTLSIRTIQRIENAENEPRGKTLQLLALALELSITEFETGKKDNSWLSLTFKWIFFLLLNLGMICIYGFLTLPPQTTLQSKIGALLLALFMPYFFSNVLGLSKNTERMILLGMGPLLYSLTFIVLHGPIAGITTWLIYCIVLHLFVLYVYPFLLGVHNMKE